MHEYGVGGEARLARRGERQRGTVISRAWRWLLAPGQHARTSRHASRVAA
jgi:hypothetical protein